MAQSQASLTEQLKALIPLANKNGLYDAADFLRSKVEAVEAKERADEIGRLYRKTELSLPPVAAE